MLSSKHKAEILRTHISKGQEERSEWDRYTAWYLGDDASELATDGRVSNTTDSDGSTFRLDTNYPYAFIDTMIANICPTNPMLTINARSKDRYESAKSREALVNDTFRREKLHAKSWDIAANSSLCGRAFSKTYWSRKQMRPVVKILNPRGIFFDPTVDWDETRYVIEAIKMTEAQFSARLADPEPETRWVMPDERSPNYTEVPNWLIDKNGYTFYNNAAFEVFKWIIVYEFHDLEGGTMCYMLEDLEEPIWSGPAPFKFVKNPYSKVVFNRNMIDDAGVSDVKLIARIQERLNEIDTLELWWTHVSIPVAAMNTAAFDDPEEAVESFARCTGPGDIWRFALRDGFAINQVVDYTRPPTTMPQFDKMREVCTKLIEFILGIPAYARGTYGGADVATELALVDTATRTRNGRRIRVLEDWTLDVAQKVLGVWREFFPRSASVEMRGRSPFENVSVDRFSLAFPEDQEGPENPDDFGDEFYYEYDAVSYSPTENHRLVQLQKLQQFLEPLANNPNVNQPALWTKLLELLGLEELRQDPSTAGPPVAPPGAPPGAPAAQPPPDGGLPSGTAADAIAGGGLPPGLEQAHEAILPPGTRQMADQAKTMG